MRVRRKSARRNRFTATANLNASVEPLGRADGFLPAHAAYPTQPFCSVSGKVRKGAGAPVPAAKAECRLWVQKGDDRRNALQRAKCAVERTRSREGSSIAVGAISER